LRDVSMEIRRGEIVCLLGGNASGKSTTMKTVIGSVRPAKGSVWYEGEDITNWNTSRRVARGIAIVPEARRIFPRLTVLENLMMGAFIRNDRAEIEQDLESVLEMFPRLRERRAQKGGTMSGGEQQMLAMARALACQPKVLLVDELSLGLAPMVVDRLLKALRAAADAEGLAVLLVEQQIRRALAVADRWHLLSNGVITDSGRPEDRARLQASYFAGMSDSRGGE